MMYFRVAYLALLGLLMLSYVYSQRLRDKESGDGDNSGANNIEDGVGKELDAKRLLRGKSAVACITTITLR